MMNAISTFTAVFLVLYGVLAQFVGPLADNNELQWLALAFLAARSLNAVREK